MKGNFGSIAVVGMSGNERLEGVPYRAGARAYILVAIASSESAIIARNVFVAHDVMPKESIDALATHRVHGLFRTPFSPRLPALARTFEVPCPWTGR
jgi:hypothetical protein